MQLVDLNPEDSHVIELFSEID
ncbi:GNAT family N-acetyltransferase, partial [Pseudoalteromonas sp. S3178]